MKISSNGELTFLDAIAIISFCVGLQNLELNLTEGDLTEQTRELDRGLREVVDDIHNHLSVQDAKLNIILEALNDKNKKVG